MAGVDPPWPRRVLAAGVLVGVVAVHGCVAERVAAHLDALGDEADMPPRIEVAYVRDMDFTAPAKASLVATPVVLSRPPTHARHVAMAPGPPASQARPESIPQPPAKAASDPALQEPAPPPEDALAPLAADASPTALRHTATPPATAAATASAPAFVWPASTRVSYALTGNYRGPIEGRAQVEWVHVGERYQVHLDVRVGLPIAPLLTRRMTSDGHLSGDGLVPERYDEESKLAFNERRHWTIRFDPDAVELPGGRRVYAGPGVQDAASQFVQLTYLFTLHPEWLTSGRSVDVPLALPRHVDLWTYDVQEQETLDTPFGPVDAVHLRPRRVARAGGDLTAEIWFAPTLAYLPVRIRIRQDAQTYIDLLIERRPQLAQ